MAISNQRSTNPGSKFAKANAIYNEMANAKEVFTRKQIIERMVTDLGLTASGAATYYFKIRKNASGAVAEVAS